MFVVSVSLSKSVPRDADAIIVGLTQVSGTPALVDLPSAVEKDLSKRFGMSALTVAIDLGAKSKAGSTVILPTVGGVRLVVVGLGEVDVTPEQVRRAVANGIRALAKLEPASPLNVVVSLDLAEPEVIKGAAEGALLGAYTYTKIGSQPTELLNSLTLVSTSTKPEAKDAVIAATAIAAGINQTRDWINAPANILHPESFAAAALATSKKHKLDVEVLDEKALAKAGFGGILAVGMGSARPPRLVRISYSPRGARNHLALIGKGITFDTGGINLKPSDGIYTMKSDMSGAATVISAIQVIAELGLKLSVTVYAAMAENMPSGSAQRPSDVITMYGGKTVENYNSDAEGRLVLADALTRATEDKPDLMVDVATLTGACVVALGEHTAGLMASDDQTADRLLDAAEAAGEAFWQLPITDEAGEQLTSKVADLKSGGARWGGALSAAAFLQNFTSGIDWAHLDIAGPAFNEKEPYDYVPSGGTGVGVRTLVALAQSLQG